MKETEGIVRLEAVNLIRIFYINNRFEDDDKLLQIYDLMEMAAINDFDSDVREKGLEFWDEVIQKHLKNQGMIDGDFPEITFSKETRKIVTLNETEIRKRLLKVLAELHTKCTKILKNAVLEDCCVSVTNKSVEILKKFREILRKYKVTSDPTDKNINGIN